MRKKQDSYESLQKIYKQVEQNDEELLRFLDEQEALEDDEDYDPYYVYTPTPKAEPEPVQKVPFRWNQIVSMVASVVVIVAACKVIFSHTLDLRWWLAGAVLFIAFFIMRKLDI